MSEEKPIARTLLRGAPHQNHGLFSDHYLNETLPNRLDWQQLSTSAEVTQCLTDLRKLLAKYVPTSNEAQTEEGLIKPVLEALGHAFEVQPSLDTPGIRTTPDYVFYVDEAARNSNKNIKLTEAALAGRAYAVGDAKYWDRKLDVSVKGGGDLKTNANPSWQIDFYIRYSGLSWGILTNG
ncbi:MAG TPA: hypothetical protein VNL35_09655, partial [Chloroflexota bacterium]|nr:hypothetical protein [Chloroflexota bacterium]